MSIGYLSYPVVKNEEESDYYDLLNRMVAIAKKIFLFNIKFIIMKKARRKRKIGK